MPYVIKYEDGLFNYGPPDTLVNGFAVQLEEATRYPTRAAAERKAAGLGYPDNSGFEIVEVPESVGAEVPEDQWRLVTLQSVRQGLTWARDLERAACIAQLTMSDSELRLMAGEMTAQELRTVKAVLGGCVARIRSGWRAPVRRPVRPVQSDAE